MSTSRVQRTEDARAINSSVPVSSELTAEQWSPEVIFHDPLPSNKAEQTTKESRQRKPDMVSRKPKHPETNSRQSKRREAIEAVSRDLAALAWRASVDSRGGPWASQLAARGQTLLAVDNRPRVGKGRR